MYYAEWTNKCARGCVSCSLELLLQEGACHRSHFFSRCSSSVLYVSTSELMAELSKKKARYIQYAVQVRFGGLQLARTRTYLLLARRGEKVLGVTDESKTSLCLSR